MYDVCICLCVRLDIDVFFCLFVFLLSREVIINFTTHLSRAPRTVIFSPLRRNLQNVTGTSLVKESEAGSLFSPEKNYVL